MIIQKHGKDCLQACLSELLEISYEEIPEFYMMYPKDVDLFSAELDGWLRSRGYFRILMDSRYDEESGSVNMPLVSLESYRCIGVLEKPERSYSHAVVLEVKNGKIILHDPKPDSDYDLRDLIQIEFILPLPVFRKGKAHDN